jgi:hypothetical protein
MIEYWERYYGFIQIRKRWKWNDGICNDSWSDGKRMMEYAGLIE